MKRRRPDGAHPTRTDLPDVGGFRDTLLIAAGICAATAVISFVLPGRSVDQRPPSTADERVELEEIMKEEGELAGAGLVLAEAQNPSASREHAP